MQKPTMQVWTDAWKKADPEVFKNVYAENGLVFPPNKPTNQVLAKRDQSG